MVMETFVEKYFEKKVLHIQLGEQRTSTHYENLLTREKLDFFLNEQNVKHPTIKLVGVDDDFKHTDYVEKSGRVNVSKLYKYYGEGATINVVGLHDYLLPLGNLCKSLTMETAHRYQTNIYCTPKNSQGFQTHYDSHDVIVLQVHGEKDWEIYDNPVKLPLKGVQDFTKNMDIVPKLKQKIRLKTGELLYIPRGVMHNARTTDSSSIHITLGLLGTSYYNLIADALKELAVNDERYRRYLPFGYLNRSASAKTIETTIKQIVADMVQNIDAKKAIGNMERLLIKENHAKVLHQLKAVDAVLENKIDYSSARFYFQKNLRIKTSIKDENLIIQANGQEHTFPDYTEPVFLKMMQKKEFTLADLGNELDDEGKEVMINYLIMEGMVYV